MLLIAPRHSFPFQVHGSAATLLGDASSLNVTEVSKTRQQSPKGYFCSNQGSFRLVFICDKRSDFAGIPSPRHSSASSPVPLPRWNLLPPFRLPPIMQKKKNTKQTHAHPAGLRWDLRCSRREGPFCGEVYHQGLEKWQAKEEKPASSHLPDRRSMPLAHKCRGKGWR